MAAKVLVIVESPAKAKTIARFLGRSYAVKSSMGHVRDLPKSQLGVDVVHHFQPKYITIRGKGELLKDLKSLARQCQHVLLATDPDREGEAIAWHLGQVLQVDENSPCRIEFHEITKEAIFNAVKAARPINKNLVDAQQARRVLDRLVGYSLSPLLWRKVKKGLSAGRVQSVALRMVAEREEEIQEFIPQEYWTVIAKLEAEDGSGTLDARLWQFKGKKITLNNEQEATDVVALLKTNPCVVLKVKRSKRSKNPAPPFITSTLQQDSFRRLGFTARRTMRVAQQLYEGIELDKKQGAVGLITYMRTDSIRVAEHAVKEARDFILEAFGKEYVGGARKLSKGGRVQDAHEAIRPTQVLRTPDAVKPYLNTEQLRLYKLIWERFVASQMAAVLLEVATIDVGCGDYILRATGSKVKFPGFTRLYGEAREGEDEEGAELPDIQVGARLTLKKVDSKQHFTQPPPRYSEASLVKTMEELGIGRPSTYAPTIETIISRGYVSREKKQLYPTELGMLVTGLLKEHFSQIVDFDFTAAMESKLDQVEAGDEEWEEIIENFYLPFRRTLDQAEHEIEFVELEPEISEEKCEKCGRNMVVKIGRYGKFLACPGFPECRFTKPLLEDVGVNCPKCDGRIVLRRSKKGRTFYGCSNYPGCDYVAWDKPTSINCPKCGTRLLEKVSRGKARVVCPGKDCGYVLEEAQVETARR